MLIISRTLLLAAVLCLPALRAAAMCDADLCQLEIFRPANLDKIPVVASVNSLRIGDNVFIQEDESNAGAIVTLSGESIIGSGSEVGSIFAHKVVLKNNSRVSGDIVATNIEHEAIEHKAGSSLPVSTATPDGQLKGTNTEFKLPAYSATTPKVQVNTFSRMSLLPGRYKDVVVGERAELALRTGIYYFDSFEVLKGANISVDTQAGTVYVYVMNAFSHAGKLTYNGTASDMVISYFGSQDVSITGELDTNLYAPYSTVEFATTGTEGIVHNGTVYANTVVIQNVNTIRAARATHTGPASEEISSKTRELNNDQLILGFAESDVLLDMRATPN